jgi:2-methylcitrate dehydratase PrpD
VELRKVRSGTEELAEFVSHVNYKEIPEEVIEVAKIAFLDYLGVSIGGSREPSVKILSRYVAKLGSKGEASIVSLKRKTSPEMAALVNGTAAHSLDYDDTFANVVRYNVHPSVSIFPAVMALCEKYKLPGSRVLSSYVAGIEAEYRLGFAIGQYTSSIGWHPTPILGSIAAAAACANVLKLNTYKTQMAMGIAGSLAGGLQHNFNTMNKSMHAGNAARNGVLAAILARSGFTSSDAEFNGELSFCNMFSGGNIKDLSHVNDEMIRGWGLVSFGLGFKPYPCCRATHAAIDAMLYLRDRFNINPSEVTKITCKTMPILLVQAACHLPKKSYEARFSFDYCLATALLNGRVVLEDFMESKIGAVERQKLASKVVFIHPPNWGKGTVNLKTEVTVNLIKGKEYCHKVDLPKGEPGNPMTAREFISKFRDCAHLVLKEKDIEETLELALHIDQIDNVDKLMRMTIPR